MIGAHSAADGALSASKATDGLFQLELIRKLWNGTPLALHTMLRATFTWPVSTSSRTIGAAGQLVGTRPLQVLAAKVIPVGQTTEQDVDVISHGQYSTIGNKAQTAAVFSQLLYEPSGAAVGTLTVWPVPTTAPTLVLHHRALLAAITADATIDLPEMYEPALVSRLAKRCAPIFGKPWTRELEEIARDDWAVVQRTNQRIPDEVSMPAGFPGTRRGGVSDSSYDAGTF